MVSENIDKIDALTKIKEAKELLNIGAITEEEFNQIKNKYFKLLHKSEQIPEIPKTYEEEIRANINNINQYRKDSYSISENRIQSLIKSRSKETSRNKKKIKWFIICPHCGKITSIKTNRCTHCNIMLNNYIIRNAKTPNNLINNIEDNSLENNLDDSVKSFVNNDFKICPSCGKEILKNAIRCKYCKTMLKTYSKDNSQQNIGEDTNLDDSVKSFVNNDFKICPSCGKEILKNAIRCKYCKTMLKTYSKDNSQQIVKTSNKSSSDIIHDKNLNVNDDSSDNKPILDENLIKIIEENTDEVCRIFSISNLGKKFVINKLTNDYTQDEISEKLRIYIVDSKKESSISKRAAYKLELMNIVKQIPDIHFKIYFIIYDLSFKSKNKFINHIQIYWNPKEIKMFYDKYVLLSKQGIQEIHLKKVLKYDLEETCKIFSISSKIRKLGSRFVINRVFNNYSIDEIKNKLDSHFELSDKFVKEIPTTIILKSKHDNINSLLSSKPNYYAFKVQTNKFKSQFEEKENNVRELIEKCFPAPQMTNSKFNSIVDDCSKLFYHKVESIMLILESTKEYSDKLENELISDIKILEEMSIKLDSLHEELLIVHSEDDNNDVENLLDEMDNLIDSVHYYKQID